MGVPRVDVENVVDAPKARVYDVVRDMERFAQFMPDVESVAVVERGDGYTVTEWKVRVRGARLRWTERDEFLPDRITYRQVKGDFKQFEGEWRFDAESPAATRVTLVTVFEFGLPMLAALLNPVAAAILRENARSMLASVTREAVTCASGGSGDRGDRSDVYLVSGACGTLVEPHREILAITYCGATPVGIVLIFC